jgi:hypothetical protein|tara:strand:+ start:2420 stop:2947 length:528 start_codon:yes stop_codon:yes gene_type:complete
VSNINLTVDEIESAIQFCDSYTRLPELMKLYNPATNDLSAWFQVLGDNWDCCDNIWRYRADLAKILGNASPEHIALMMTPKEREALANLPDVITIYRGCYSWNDAGLSWSLSRDIAAQFPTLMRYSHPGHEPFIDEATANKRNCVLKLDRDEQEVICWSHSFESRYFLGKQEVSA